MMSLIKNKFLLSMKSKKSFKCCRYLKLTRHGLCCYSSKICFRPFCADFGFFGKVYYKFGEQVDEFYNDYSNYEDVKD